MLFLKFLLCALFFVSSIILSNLYSMKTIFVHNKKIYLDLKDEKGCYDMKKVNQALQEASCKGYEQVINFLITNPKTFNCLKGWDEYFFDDALWNATIHNHIDIVKLLITNETIWNYHLSTGSCIDAIFDNAVQNDRHAIVEFLATYIKTYACLNKCYIREKALFYAARNNCPKTVKFLIRNRRMFMHLTEESIQEALTVAATLEITNLLKNAQKRYASSLENYFASYSIS